MEPIFDRAGVHVGWLAGEVILDRDLEPRAFASRGAIFSYNRRFLGWLDSGYFRDGHGDAVAFVRGAWGTPPPPPAGRVAAHPVGRLAGVPPFAPVPPQRPAWTSSWSRRGWDAYVDLVTT